MHMTARFNGVLLYILPNIVVGTRKNYIHGILIDSDNNFEISIMLCLSKFTFKYPIQQKKVRDALCLLEKKLVRFDIGLHVYTF